MQDLFTIIKTVNELKGVLVGAKINRIIEPCDDEVIFTLFSGKVFNLILSAQAKYCRVGLTRLEKQSPLTAPNFCMLLRKYLLGSEIINVETLPNDRVVALTVKNENDFKENNEYIVYVEIMGKYSNVFLTQKGVILGSLKTTPQTLNGKRIVMTGTTYAPPKSQGKHDILNKEQSLEILKGYTGENLDKFLLSNFNYFAPLTASELAFRINKKLNGKEFDAVIAYQVIEDFISQDINPVIITCKNFKDVFACDYKHLEGERIFNPSLINLQQQFYDEILKEADFLNIRNSLLSKINSKIKKEEKKLFLCEEREREFKNADKYKLYGELITANLYAIKKGQEKVKVLNYYEETETYIEIPLDATLSPNENSQKYYKKYAKLKRSYSVSLEQKQEVLDELNYLNSLKAEVELSTKLSDFKDVEDELVLYGLMRDNEPKKRKKQVKKHDGYTLYKIDGFNVKMGRNNLQNDELLESAERLDIWLHTKNYHSSFVIIETKGKEVSDTVILTCAEICASHSEAKNGSKIEVDYTFKKHVKKPPKSKPGTVFYTDYKTILVNPNSHEELMVKQ